MQPAVPPPKGARIGRPIEFTLRPGWRYDAGRALFLGASGETFVPEGLPPRSRIVYTVPSLASAKGKGLSAAERDLQRYMRVILPRTWPPEKELARVQAWPCVETARASPEVSLPKE